MLLLKCFSSPQASHPGQWKINSLWIKCLSFWDNNRLAKVRFFLELAKVFHFFLESHLADIQQTRLSCGETKESPLEQLFMMRPSSANAVIEDLQSCIEKETGKRKKYQRTRSSGNFAGMPTRFHVSWNHVFSSFPFKSLAIKYFRYITPSSPISNSNILSLWSNMGRWMFFSILSL